MNTLTQTVPITKAADIPPRFASNPQPVRRILVLVPSFEQDLTEAARKVWALASCSGAHVRFFSLYSSPAEEPALRRELTTLASLVQDATITTDIETLSSRNWVEVINTWAADLLVCFPEAKKSHILQNQLARLNPLVPLYLLSTPEDTSITSARPMQIAAWAGSIAILIVFFYIQSQLAEITPDWLNLLLMSSSVLVEFGALWFLNGNL